VSGNNFRVIAILVAIASTAGAQTPAAAKATDYAAEGTRIVQALAAGKSSDVAARFDTQMQKELPQAKLSESWGELVAKAGKFQKVTATEVKPQPGGYHCVAMTCAFEHAPEGDALVTFDEAGRIAGLYFGPRPTEQIKEWEAPSYATPDRFEEVPVKVSTGAWHLPGTLSLPKGKRPCPAVVLIPGSPPLDQDESIGPNKVFKDLAWGLASRGIAVLRYTKRTCQYGAGLGGGFISSFSPRDELIDDAHAAFTLLAARREIDPAHIYLVGHSLGGVAAAMVAADESRVAGVVLLGTPSSNLLTALVEREEDAAREGKQANAGGPSMLAALKKIRSGETAPGSTLDIMGMKTPASYFLEMRKYDTGNTTAKLKAPVMVLLGGHDAQVPDREFERWKNVLSAKKDATVKLYPGLFHLFMPSASKDKGDTPEDWMRPAHVSREVVDDVAAKVLEGR
jgi:dienelactone hydrolase